MVQEDEDQLIPHRKQQLKSGKVWTADSMVTMCVTWLYEVVYNIDRKAAVYDERRRKNQSENPDEQESQGPQGRLTTV